MTEVPAIVEYCVDIERLARTIARGVIEYNDAERALRAAERKTEGMREAQQRRRLDLGSQLIEAKRGIKHGGWLPYIEKLGIPQQTANAWMREAGFLDEQAKSPASEHAGDLRQERYREPDDGPHGLAQGVPCDEANGEMDAR